MMEFRVDHRREGQVAQMTDETHNQLKEEQKEKGFELNQEWMVKTLMEMGGHDTKEGEQVSGVKLAVSMFDTFQRVVSLE